MDTGAFVGWLMTLAQTKSLPRYKSEYVLHFLVNSLGFPRTISSSIRESLSGYTFKAREKGLLAVLGADRMAQFQTFIDQMDKEFGDSVQVTEAGYTKIGTRRLLWDIIAFSYECMDADAFYAHVHAAAVNGEIYEKVRQNTPEMLLVKSPVNGRDQLPASFPGRYPVLLGKFARDHWSKPESA